MRFAWSQHMLRFAHGFRWIRDGSGMAPRVSPKLVNDDKITPRVSPTASTCSGCGSGMAQGADAHLRPSRRGQRSTPAVCDHGARSSPRAGPVPSPAPMRRGGHAARAATSRGAAPGTSPTEERCAEREGVRLEPGRLRKDHTEFFTKIDSEPDQAEVEVGKNNASSM